MGRKTFPVPLRECKYRKVRGPNRKLPSALVSAPECHSLGFHSSCWEWIVTLMDGTGIPCSTTVPLTECSRPNGTLIFTSGSSPSDNLEQLLIRLPRECLG